MVFSNMVSTQMGTVFIWSLVITIVILILNSFVSNSLFDIVVGMSLASSVSSLVGLLTGQPNITGSFYLTAVVILVIYLAFIVFVLRHISKVAETSNTITSKDYEGKVGTVVTTIPETGMGEVLITVSLQKIAVPSKIYQGNKDELGTPPTSLKQGTQVLVIENKDNVLYVTPYKEQGKE